MKEAPKNQICGFGVKYIEGVYWSTGTEDNKQNEGLRMENIKLEKIGHWARINHKEDKFLVELQPQTQGDNIPLDDEWEVAGINLVTIFDTLEQAKKFIELEQSQEMKNGYPVLDIDDLIRSVTND